MSRIPQMHAFESLYAPPNSTVPLASKGGPGAAKGFEGDTSKHDKFQQEGFVKKRLPSSYRTLDRPPPRLAIEDASIGIRENVSAKAPIQELLVTSSPLTPLLPEAKTSPRASFGPSIRSAAFVPDADLFPRLSSTLSSSSAVPVISGTSNSLASVAISSDSKLGDYFRPLKHPRTQYTDIQCQDIARLLRENGKDSWCLVPRLYIILRTIGQLPILDAFIDQGINDFWLPLSRPSLPQELSLAYHQEFIATQPLVLTKALDLENNTKSHAHFTRGDPFPFEVKGTLGTGGYGTVDRISSPLSGREFARKRFRRNNMRGTRLESFMNEVKVLKRLHHIHCVELVSISSNIKRLVRTQPSPRAEFLNRLPAIQTRSTSA